MEGPGHIYSSFIEYWCRSGASERVASIHVTNSMALKALRKSQAIGPGASVTKNKLNKMTLKHEHVTSPSFTRNRPYMDKRQRKFWLMLRLSSR